MALAACDRGGPAPIPVPPADNVVSDAILERGQYLVNAGNCFACHTSSNGAPFAGGVAFHTPLGTIYSTNITPHAESGIGTWAKADFRRAMHEGIAADGSRLFPAFPYTAYAKVTDDDVDAIYAYLRTVPPVDYKPPRNGFLFSQRWVMRFWNALFFEEGRFVPDPDESLEWNRGAYLVEGLGHCGACHTPRNRFMADISHRAQAGGVIWHEVAPGKVRRWSAVNLTPAKSGLGAWSVDDLTAYLGTGFSPRAGTFGPMNKVVVHSLMKLTDADIRAMAVYINSLPASDEYEGPGVPPELVTKGEPIYDEHCSECHRRSGRGGIFHGPPLAGSATVQSITPYSLINVIMYGPDMPDEVSFGGWETMRAYGDRLTDEEIAAVINYVRGSWGNLAPPVTDDEVARQR